MVGPWSQFTQEDWKYAKYCSDCGLPLIQDEETKEWFCVYCTWMEDEEVIHQQAKRALEEQYADKFVEHINLLNRRLAKIQSLEKQIHWESPLHSTPLPGVRYEVWQQDLLTFDTYNELGYWESGITPQWYRYVEKP